jgi:hypothetical protein
VIKLPIYRVIQKEITLSKMALVFKDSSTEICNTNEGNVH